MTSARKVKISLSMDAGLLASVDRAATKAGQTRSALVERWLRDAQRRSLMTRLEEETAVYYDALTSAEKADDLGWATAASRAARRLDFDQATERVRPRRASRPRRG